MFFHGVSGGGDVEVGVPDGDLDAYFLLCFAALCGVTGVESGPGIRV